MIHLFLRRACVALVALSILSPALAPVAQAAIVGTADAVAVEQRVEILDAVRAGLAREDVRDRMLALGVEPGQVDGRLDALTDAELATLAGRLDELPAGGDALAVIGIVFLVLLLLEFTGTIDIFKKVP